MSRDRPTSSLVFHVTPVGSDVLIVGIDFSERHEIAVMGQRLQASPSIQVLKDDVPTADFNVSGIGLDPTLKQVVFTLSAASPQVPGEYLIVIRASLTSGETLYEGLTLEAERPPGGLFVRCR